MPTPWGPHRPEFNAEIREWRHLEQPRKRAITLRQLRELREFVKRLCKTGLLRFPDNAHNERLGRVGRNIKWTEISQHEITSEIIKKVIPKECSCSWSELVANGRPQSRDFFCSHSWSEPFRDFMATIEHHARENNVGSEDAYWICVYANDQWAVDLGWKLTDSPFYEALRGSQATVLLLDRKFEVFFRMWVVFEMNQTRALGQTLEIWSPVGRVGSPQVASGPMVKALDLLNTAAAEASNPCDQRQIMNYIAGVDEMAGLLRSSEGGKQLDPQAIPSYERTLVEDHRDRFEDLNCSIREAAQVTAQPRNQRRSSLRRTPSEVDPALRGITLVQLRTFAQKVSDYFRASSFVCDDPDSPVYGKAVAWETATWKHVYEHVILQQLGDMGAGMNCSYVHMITDEDQRPEYLWSFSWYATYRNFMAGVEWHAESRQLSDSTVYWIDALALAPKELGVDCKAGVRGAKHEIPSRVIRDHAAGVVLYVDKRGYWAGNGWTTYQIHLAFECGKSFDIADKDGLLATTRPFADTSWCFGNLGVVAAQQVLDFDVTKIKMNEADRRMILNSIAGLPSSQQQPPEMCLEFKLMNNLLNSKAAGPLLRAAAFSGDVMAIDKVMKTCPGLNLDEKGLAGVLGEKALHIAAAAGHVECSRYLLLRGSDPNAADLSGETPLHVAALAGQRGTTELLLELQADPMRKNYDGETPLHVALQNPAYFLGVETAKVSAALEDAQAQAKRRGRRMGNSSMSDGEHLSSEQVCAHLAERLQQELAAKQREVANIESQLARLQPDSEAAAAAEPPDTPKDEARARSAAPATIKQKLGEYCGPGQRVVPVALLQDLLCSLGCTKPEVHELCDGFKRRTGMDLRTEDVDFSAFLEWLFA